MKTIDMRSDTVTKPTEEMRKAAFEAEVGDDVFGDDPTVNQLEKYAAELFGKEAAVFVTSGTQGNLTSILAHTRPGDEILLEAYSHIFYYEAGGISAVGGVIPKLYQSNRGIATREDIDAVVRTPNIHYPDTSLLCIENTHNRHGGVALSVSQVKELSDTGREYGLKIHLDGARIFNASIAHGVDLKEYANLVDSVQFCLSKGLSAPIGSIVAGSSDFVDKVRKKRKMLGGGMRQSGIVAAPGLIALQKMRDRLKQDHQNAQLLVDGLRGMGLKVWDSDTNIVVCDVSSHFSSSGEAIALLQQDGILTVPFSSELIRLTTNRHITHEDIEFVLDRVRERWINTSNV